jgi:hypothetical protein
LISPFVEFVDVLDDSIETFEDFTSGLLLKTADTESEHSEREMSDSLLELLLDEDSEESSLLELSFEESSSSSSSDSESETTSPDNAFNFWTVSERYSQSDRSRINDSTVPVQE